MFNLDWIQSKAAGKNILSFAGGAVTVAAMWGIVSTHDAQVLTQGFTDIWDGVVLVAKGVAAVGGVLAGAYATIRAAMNTTPAQRVASVAELSKDPASPVKGVIVEPTPEGKVMAEASSGVVPAGTVQATSMAKVGG